MPIAPWLLPVLWREHDWSAALDRLTQELRAAAPGPKALRATIELAQAYEYIVPDRRSVLAVYELAGEAARARDIAIELGWFGLCAILLIAAVVCVLLLRGALQRGRDSFYATAAAGGVVLITVEAFCDASLVDVAASTMAAVLLGLGVAQSVSRTVQ